MRYYIGLVFLIFLSSQAVAQLTGVNIDSTSIPAEEIDQVSIDQDTGELIITTKSGYEVKPAVTSGEVAITKFKVNGRSSALLPSPGQATISWTSINANECTASTTPSNVLADWNNTILLNNSGFLPVDFPENGSYMLTLRCTGQAGSPAVSNVEVTVGAVTIKTFTATPDHSPVEAGDDVSVTLRWTTENAVACYGSWVGGSGQLTNLNGSNVRSFKNVASDMTFTLTCEGSIAEDPVEKTARIDVVARQTKSCDNVSLGGLVKPWGGSGGVLRIAWPGPRSQIEAVQIPELGYLALEFDTGSVQANGQVATIEYAGTPGARLGSISSCAGDFDVPNECKYVWGAGGGIIWDTTGTVKGACQLQPQKTYYWNITFTEGVKPADNTSRCTGSYCQTWLQVVNPNYK